MRCPPVFEKVDPLPRSKHQPALIDGDDFTGPGKHHLDVGGRVVIAFECVREIFLSLGDEPVKIGFKIDTGGRIRIFKNDQAGTDMLDENCGRSGADAAQANDPGHLLGDLICPLAFRPDLKGFAVSVHLILV